MREYLRRLITTGAAYQAADVASKGIALITLPLYTRHVGTAGYGAANSLLTAVILVSILLRLGVGEAFVRFYYDDEDPVRRARLGRTTTAIVGWTTTIASLLVAANAATVSQWLLGFRDPILIDCAVVGLWAFTNLEIAYAQLRVDERARTYLIASASNVAMTVVFTVALVVFADQGARGLLLGNFAASAIVVVGLWALALRGRVGWRVRRDQLDELMQFGLPTVPADASVYALQVADRFYLLRAVSPSAAGLYAGAVQLATVVFVAVRGFQYAWPPLAYSVQSDEEAARLYSLVATYFMLGTGVIVAAVTLLARWMVRLLLAPQFYGAYRALPWLALGWSLYGLYLVLLVIAGRARVTKRNFPAAAAGLAANVLLLVLLVPASGAGLGISGAGIALCGAYVVMLVVFHLLTRNLFRVDFDWRRLALLAVILAGVSVSGELLLPTAGLVGLLARIAWLAFVPALLAVTRFFPPHELEQVRAMIVAARARVARIRDGRPPAAAP